MGQPTENSIAQGDSPAPAASLGASLREARERLGLSVADIASQTKLAPRQIEALESDDFRHLPEMPFVRGFVRSYARILQLDAQPLLAALPQTNAPPMPLVLDSVEAPFPSAHSLQRQNLVWLGVALLLSVLVVAFAVWHFIAPPAKPEAVQAETPASMPDEAPIIPAQSHVLDEKTTASQVAPQIQPEKPADEPAAPIEAAMLHLMFDKESWVEIRDKDDKVLSSQINPPGSELRMDGQAPFLLVIGNAASVRLYYRGEQVDMTPYISPPNGVARLTLK